MSEIVYVLTNEAMPDLIKIGVTARDDVKQRIEELSHPSGIPLPFECHYAGEVEGNAAEVEKLLHAIFSEYRINPKREFFRIDPEKAVLALRLARPKDVTPQFQSEPDTEEAEAIEAAQRRRSNTVFEKLGIVPGTELTLSRDDNSKCTVVAGNRVEYEGHTMSSSAAALLALNKLGYTSKSVAGPGYWMLNGKTICEIRRVKEQKDSENQG